MRPPRRGFPPRAASLIAGGGRRDSAAALWAQRFAGLALALMLVAAPAHRYGLLETVAFFWVLGIAGTLAAVAAGLSAAGFAGLLERGDRAGRRSLAALLMAALVLAPFAVGLWRFASHPRLDDISTDVTDPPRFAVLPALRDPRANRLSPIGEREAALILERYPEVNGRRYEAPADTVLQAARALIAARGWKVAPGAADGAEGPEGAERPEGAETTIEALAGSYLLRLPADVALRVTDEGGSTYVDMRSASHFGTHDLGDNAMRITRFLAELDAAVAAAGR